MAVFDKLVKDGWDCIRYERVERSAAGSLTGRPQTVWDISCVTNIHCFDRSPPLWDNGWHGALNYF